MSLPEILLWQRLKGSPQGIAFPKQHPISGYRVDFYCAAAKLVIEVDGAGHDMGDRPERDVERTKWLEAKGYQVIRISAADVLRDADAAAQSIVSFVADPLHHASGARWGEIVSPGHDLGQPGAGQSPNALPVNGEDFS